MDEETMRARKRELRRRLRSDRSAAYTGADGAARRAEESQALLEQAAPLIAEIERAASTALAADRPAPLVAAYHPAPTEADVMPLARRLAAAGARMVFPAASAGPELEWIIWDGISPFQDSPARGFGQEPTGERLGRDALAQARLVLAPAVAVDRAGTRIGHGGGYYDRALASLPAAAQVIAVIHPAELLAAGTLPRGPHDMPVPAVLTADGLVSLVTSARS